MTKKNASRAPLGTHGSHHVYSPDILPRMQALLAALADLDCGYETDVETVRTSNAPEAIKQGVIETLRLRHQERRARFSRELEALQRRVLKAA